MLLIMGRLQLVINHSVPEVMIREILLYHHLHLVVPEHSRINGITRME
jgi:hypothetical protein